MPKSKPDLYLLVDGTYADPSECDLGADNMLRNANGTPVALREDGNPQTLSQGAVENKNVEAAEASPDVRGPVEPVTTESIKPEEAGATETKVETLIDPATGQPAEETTAVAPEAAVHSGEQTANEARADTQAAHPEKAKEVDVEPAKKYKNRELKGR